MLKFEDSDKFGQAKINLDDIEHEKHLQILKKERKQQAK